MDIVEKNFNLSKRLNKRGEKIKSVLSSKKMITDLSKDKDWILNMGKKYLVNRNTEKGLGEKQGQNQKEKSKVVRMSNFEEVESGFDKIDKATENELKKEGKNTAKVVSFFKSISKVAKEKARRIFEKKEKEGAKEGEKGEKKAKEEKETEKESEKTKKNNDDGIKYGPDDELFDGQKLFPEDFATKDDRSILKKWMGKYRLDKERKSIKKTYDNKVKNLNEEYFKRLLGEERIAELRDLPLAEKRHREREMIKEILASIKSPEKRASIERKLKYKEAAEDKILERQKSIFDESKLARDRRKYSIKVEREIEKTLKEMSILKANRFFLPGDKEDHKDLKNKLKRLKKIKREKESFIVKFTKERLKARRERVNTPEFTAEMEDLKKDILIKSKKAGLQALKGIGTVIAAPFKGIVEGIKARDLGEGVGNALFKSFEGFKDIGASIIQILPILGIYLKVGARYATGK